MNTPVDSSLPGEEILQLMKRFEALYRDLQAKNTFPTQHHLLAHYT